MLKVLSSGGRCYEVVGSVEGVPSCSLLVTRDTLQEELWDPGIFLFAVVVFLIILFVAFILLFIVSRPARRAVCLSVRSYRDMLPHQDSKTMSSLSQGLEPQSRGHDNTSL